MKKNNNVSKNDSYYKSTSFRRKYLDILQNKFKDYYKGIVLDIGGRDRGKFQKPKQDVEKWIFADINSEYNPDIILDITDMSSISSDTVDVINTIEVFEHVVDINKGLSECHRVLKKNGIFIISTPFLYAIHADPIDFQRWTASKWKYQLIKFGFSIEKFIIMGKFYTHMAEMIRDYSKYSRVLNFLRRAFYPLLNKLVALDSSPKIKDDAILNKYHCGYFIIAKKI